MIEKNDYTEQIKQVLREIYGTKLSESDLLTYAFRLNRSLQNENDLTDIFSVIYECEAEFEIEDGEAGSAFTEVRQLLLPSHETAQRLYDCFMNSYDGYDIAIQLFFENARFLTDEQIENAAVKAARLYDQPSLSYLFGNRM